MCLLLQSLERGGGKDDMVHIDYHKRRCDIVTQQHRILIIKSNLNPSTPSPPSVHLHRSAEKGVVRSSLLFYINPAGRVREKKENKVTHNKVTPRPWLVSDIRLNPEALCPLRQYICLLPAQQHKLSMDQPRGPRWFPVRTLPRRATS